MATDNKSLTVYLETEILEALTDYCLSNGITRRDKTTPILATGAVELLKQALGLSLFTGKSNDNEKKLSDLTGEIEAIKASLAALEALQKPVKATEETPNDGKGLTAVALARLFPEKYGVKCCPEYLSLFLSNSPRCPERVKEILATHWTYQARRWYPKGDEKV